MPTLTVNLNKARKIGDLTQVVYKSKKVSGKIKEILVHDLKKGWQMWYADGIFIVIGRGKFTDKIGIED